MPDAPGRPRLAYVAGTARSGSTLVGDLLQSLDGVEHLGEAHWRIVHRGHGVAPSAPCGCGEAAGECPFWAPLQDELAGRDSDAYRRLIAAAGDALDAEVVVDSSKGLPSLLGIARAVGVDAVIVTRRPLVSFVRSRYRHATRKRRGRRSRPRLLVAAAADAVRWIGTLLWTTVSTIVLPRRGVPVVSVTLDRICDEPALVRATIADALGVAVGDPDPDQRSFETGPTHTIWGSRSRIRPDGLLEVAATPPPGWTSRDK